MIQTTTLPTGTWQVDTSKTTVTVTAKKLGVFTIPATLSVNSGTIEINDDHELTNVDILVDAASYTSKSSQRNTHVTSGGFLDPEAYPTIAFRSGAVEPIEGGFQSRGAVTVNGQTSPIDVAITGVAFDESEGSFIATASIDRKAIGVGQLPTFVIGRDLELVVSGNASRMT